jgi:hypothetical protein
MAGVFKNIDPPTPLSARRVCPPRLWCGGRTHSLGGEGVGVNILEDVRHTSVLYVCKYFVCETNVCLCWITTRTLESPGNGVGERGMGVQPGLLFRIDLMQIRIRIQHFFKFWSGSGSRPNADPDPGPDPNADPDPVRDPGL